MKKLATVLQLSAFSVVVALSALIINPSNAQAEGSGYVGGFLGYIDPSLDDADGEIGFGGRIGALISPEFGLGINVSRYSTEEGSGTVTAKLGITPILLEGLYFLDSAQSGAYLGARLGIVQESGEVMVGGSKFSADESETGLGVLAGFNFPIAANLSAGGELGLTQVFGDPKDYNLLSLMATLNFFF